jgi:lysophospholipid acyltransferase (LPLAT)-like uncharacterized protein
MKRSLRDRLVTGLSRYLLRALASTWRITEDVPEDCRGIVEGTEQAVIVFWHGGMLPVWFRFRGHKNAALISSSRDGEILSNYLQHSLGYTTIRGSSSRGGSEALVEIVEALQTRSCLITPDGPRGPARQAKAGALIAAHRTGRPMLLAGWNSNRCWRFQSWDSMKVPKPFARIRFRYCKYATSSHRHIHTSKRTTITSDRRITSNELLQFSNALDEISGI